MKPAVALLWHLHQPDYREPTSGRPMMPWVRLHGLRGYRDLLVEAVEHDVPMTINVVPSLLDQLLWYAGGGDDPHLELTRAPAEALLDDGGHLAVTSLPAGHPMMTRAWPVWADLRTRLEAGERADVGALRDLQVWSTLCWFGATAHRDFPELRQLAAKGRGFTEEDKEVLLGVHDAVIFDLPARLKALVEAPGPSLSVSPYFHPILPLLVDARHARRCMPDLPDEVSFAYPDDALRQLVTARDRIEELAGVRPDGLWPSEGSVSPEVVALAGEAGFRWLVTDVGVLARSDRSGSDVPGPWDLGHGVVGFFRDTDLSDRIGFRYAERDPVEAVWDFVGGCLERAKGGVLTVALDGENPWESFADAGGAFRRQLYRQLADGPLRAITFDEAARGRVSGKVTRLHTGSWIGADFRIWIGHQEDRAAWRALAQARDAAEQAPPEVRERAMPHLLAAEGSDWTWWYGDDFRTPWAGTFDALFRAHLRAAYEALGLQPPRSLEHPISRPYAPQRLPPQRFLDLDWDKAASLLSWSGAGLMRAWAGAMAAGHAVRAVHYGWTRGPREVPGDLWLRVEVRGDGWRLESPPSGFEARRVGEALVVRFDGPGPVALRLRSPDGEAWPMEPVGLAPPGLPALDWWEV